MVIKAQNEESLTNNSASLIENDKKFKVYLPNRTYKTIMAGPNDSIYNLCFKLCEKLQINTDLTKHISVFENVKDQRMC